jgi:hypothetical protein
MKNILLKKAVFVAALLLTITVSSNSQTADGSRQSRAGGRNANKITARIEERNVRAQMEFLAGDAMQGRGSGTQFEWLAGQYIGSQLRQFGVEPAGETDASGGKTYIQTVNIVRNSFDEAPRISYQSNNQPVILEHGKEMIVLRLNAGEIKGMLQKSRKRARLLLSSSAKPTTLQMRCASCSLTRQAARRLSSSKKPRKYVRNGTITAREKCRSRTFPTLSQILSARLSSAKKRQTRSLKSQMERPLR